MVSNPKSKGLFSMPCRILGIVLLLSVLGGCINKENKPGVELSPLNPGERNLSGVESYLAQGSQEQNTVNEESQTNQVHFVLRPNEFNRTGKLPVMLRIANPKINETVVTVFKPEFGDEWYNKTRITYINNNNWTQNFSIKPIGNISYILVFVQISDDNFAVKKAALNITLGASSERPI